MSVPALDRMLATVEAFLRRYVVLTPAQSCALVLWVVHTHVIEAADVTPYVAITSPEKRSGKTRLLEVLELLVADPIRAANISEAYLFRSLADKRRTLLLDETDAIFSPKTEREDLRALINAGYRRGAIVGRCETQGRQVVTRDYDAYGAKALAGIGVLPDTIADRAVPIRLQRKTRSEAVSRFRIREATEGAEMLRDAIAGWAREPVVIDTLRESRPRLPEALDDRAQDGWEPLLAIADLAGGEWPGRARATAAELHTEGATDESLGVLLLSHIRDVFGDREHVSTVDLLAGLCERDDGPWAGWWARDVEDNRTRGPAARLAHLLRPYGVEPRQLWTAVGKVRGYHRADFAEVWERYVSPPTLSPGEKDGRTVERTSEALFVSEAFDGETTSDQASTVLPSLETVDGVGALSERCPACGERVDPSVGDAHRCPTGDGAPALMDDREAAR